MQLFQSRLFEIIESEQQVDGRFLTLTSPNFSQNGGNSLPTVFTTSLILHCLSYVPDSPAVLRVKHAATAYLKRQASKVGSYNYWDRESLEAKERAYPDDLDDTACALIALYRSSHGGMDGEAMAKLVTLLTLAEHQPGGPYKTWLVGKDADSVWQDSDVAVNSNIAYLLGLSDISLPALNAFLEDAIVHERFYSPYYASSYGVAYFLSRAYQGSKKHVLFDWLRKETSKATSVLDVALVTAARIHMGDTSHETLSSSSQKICEYIEHDAITVEPLWIDRVTNSVPWYAGSRALTAAYCLEVLSRYEHIVSTLPAPALVFEVTASPAENLHQRIMQESSDRLKNISEHIYTTAEPVLHRLDKQSEHAITLLPYWLRQDLALKSLHQEEDLLCVLGKINLFGWLAYTLYDDIMDDDADASRIPSANVALREVIVLCEQLVHHHPLMRQWYSGILDCIEAANERELRLSRSSRTIDSFAYDGGIHLANRSLGCAIAPMILLWRHGYEVTSQSSRSLMAFWQHYLSAKQLHDDAHDWEEDLQKERITEVHRLLWQLTPHPDIHDYDALRRVFWHEAVSRIYADILRHIDAAATAARFIVPGQEPAFLLRSLQPIESSAHKTIRQQQELSQFMHVYGSIPVGSSG